MKFKTAVVIGKFYPPHKGHKYLIDTALSQAENVSVLVCRVKDEMIPAGQRAEWLREIHPTAKRIMVVDAPLADDDSEGWAKATIEWLGYVPDAVFTSEDYGDAYAKYMGCTHVLVDKPRIAFPISGTKMRANPLQNLAFLEPCVRAHFIKKICIVGAESTGKTTLAEDLAKHYHTAWAPEYGRLYWEGKMHNPDAEQWTTDEFVHIAQQQSRLEDMLARVANEVLICDTDPFATSIWHERYVGSRSKEVEAIANERMCDLYLLADVTTPFVQDGTRDGEHIRDWMHERFVEELKAQHKPYAEIAGSREERVKKAAAIIDPLLR